MGNAEKFTRAPRMGGISVCRVQGGSGVPGHLRQIRAALEARVWGLGI